MHDIIETRMDVIERTVALETFPGGSEVVPSREFLFLFLFLFLTPQVKSL
jgi:hypothetical protein